jgi:hypothetical protein
MVLAENRVDERLGCPNEIDLAKFHQGALEHLAREAAMRSHLKGCSGCRSTIQDLADEEKFRALLEGVGRGMTPLILDQLIRSALERLEMGKDSHDGRA